jgi:hypothetical protein
MHLGVVVQSALKFVPSLISLISKVKRLWEYHLIFAKVCCSQKNRSAFFVILAMPFDLLAAFHI